MRVHDTPCTTVHDAARARLARRHGARRKLARSRERLAPASHVCWQRTRATRADSHCCQRTGTGTRYAPVQGTRAVGTPQHRLPTIPSAPPRLLC